MPNLLKNWFKTAQPYIICIVASFFYFYEYLVRVMPSAMTHNLMSSFSIHAGGLGMLSAAFFYGYAPLQIPAGMLFDQFGARRLMSATILICALATLIFGISDHFAIAILMRFIMGFMAGFAFVGALFIGTMWFPYRYFALYSGLVQFLGCIGAMLGQGPVAKLTTEFGWHKAAIYIGLLGIALSLIMYLVLRDKKTPKSTQHAQTKISENTLKPVLRIKQNWFAALYGFTVWTPTVVFASLWGVPFIKALYHTNRVHAASIVSIVWVGIAFGGPLLGWWSTKICNRKIPMITATSIGLAASLFVLYLPHPGTWVMAICLFFYGFASSAQVLSFGVAQDNNPKFLIGTAIGFTNMAVVAGGILFQPLVGYVLELLWSGKMLANTPVYSLEAYHIALFLIPLSFLTGLLTTLFLIKETHCIMPSETA